MNFARVLAKDGWTVKPVCTRTQLLAFSQSIPICPILTAPFTRAYTNTLIIAQYYAHMVQSTCLTNMSVSCMKAPEFHETGIINALPRLSRDPKFTNQTLQDLAQEKDVISYFFLQFFYAARFSISLNAQQRNILPHESLGGRSPFSILFPTKTPPLHLFKPFGCHATILKPEAALLKKTQPKGLTGIYIGTALPRGQSGYLIWIPSEKRITTAVHAVFDEFFFPACRFSP